MARTALFTTEADLDVHGVYEKARESRQRLDETFTDLTNTKEKLRGLEAELVDREVMVGMKFRADNSSMSQTQFDKEVRWAINRDDEWQMLREKVNTAKGEVDALDADRSVLKRDIEIAIGRMNSLAGYFMYLSAEKLGN